MKPFLCGLNLNRKHGFLETRSAHFSQTRSLRRELELCMDRRIGRPSHLFLRILITLVLLAPSALAQQPQPPTPAPAESQPEKAKEAKEDQDKKAPDDQVGKRKPER
jgi:hypothetical protein